MKFRNWLITGAYINESQSIAQYLKQNNADEVRQELLNVPEVKGLLTKVVAQNPIPLASGKTGLWVRSNWYIPIKIVDTEDTFVIIERTDGKDWSQIAHLWPVFADKTRRQVVLPKANANFVNDKQFYKILNWLTYSYMSSGQQEHPNTFFRKFFFDQGSRLDAIITSQDPLNTTDVSIDAIAQKQADQGSRQYRSNKPGPEGKTLIQFPNGWRWVDLEKSHCNIEGDAAGHCGNAAEPQPGENLLSLRDKDNRIHMTVVVKDGVTSEMKSPGNRKPQPYTHPYVIELLKLPMIKEVGHGKWQQDDDFKLTDLTTQEYQALSHARPDIAPMTNIFSAALEAKGNQQKFGELVKQHFNIQHFPYTYDYGEQAILIDQGSPEMMQKRRGIMWRYNRDAGRDSDFLHGTEVSPKDMIVSYWDSLSLPTQKSLAAALGTEPDKYKVAQAFDTTTDVGLRNGIRYAVQNAYQSALHAANNRHNRERGTYDGTYVTIQMDGMHPLMKLMYNRDKADEDLQQYRRLDIPEHIHMDYNSHLDQHELGPVLGNEFRHAMENSQFWQKRRYSPKGLDWFAQLDKRDDLNKIEAPPDNTL